MEPPVRGNDGKIADVPLGEAGIVLVRCVRFHQMAPSPAYNPAIPLHVPVTTDRRANHGGDVLAYELLFCDDKSYVAFPLRI